MPVLEFHNLGQSFGDVDIFIGLSASIPHGVKIGLVGPNGIGKTTLLRLLTGESTPADGVIHKAKGTRVGYLQQEAVLAFADRDHTVFEEMLTVFAGLRAQAAQLRAMEERMAAGADSEALFDAYGAAQQAFELAGGYDYELRIEQVLTGLGFDREDWHMPLAHCSGGQRTRALLARLLLERPDLLVLDEPTNHLDVAAVEWLEETLTGWNGAVLMVSHDRYFLDRVVAVIWEMGGKGLEVYRGNYTAYLMQREERWAYREKEFETVKAKFLKDLDYVKRNIVRDSSTDQAKGILRRLIRCVKAVEVGGASILNNSWSQITKMVHISGDKWSLAEVERRIKALEAPNPARARLRFRLKTLQRGGNEVLRTESLKVGYPGAPLFEIDNVLLLRQEVAALIGANGTGKSTFLKTLTGDIPPLAGEFRLGANLDISYFAQAFEVLDLEHSVLDELIARTGMSIGEARDYLARFLFRGEDVFKPMGALSGGERSRMALALLSLENANFLLLDEPTNHLDIPAQEALEEALRAYTGTILLVSHDRYLIDKLATQVWELRDGRLHLHAGRYASYVEARRAAREQSKAEHVTAQSEVTPSARGQAKASHNEAVAQTEAQIAVLESVLDRLNHELVIAGKEQVWDRMQVLGQEYKETQARLEVLMARWETLAGAATVS
ncbi:MAG: ABC-F family ATP-binding cassette domain-containing protein [Anaerolineae bacterium]|nr:ABC-F family ATP-binding cassette domain-containing protein [Anaerolineae bacterium]